MASGIDWGLFLFVVGYGCAVAILAYFMGYDQGAQAQKARHG